MTSFKRTQRKYVPKYPLRRNNTRRAGAVTTFSQRGACHLIFQYRLGFIARRWCITRN